jgi:SP family arabinose:H+ symporter-like MFS transporter
MNLRIFYWSITSALAGFLFGFDTVVISGAEQTIQKLWSLSSGIHGLAMGSALYGTVLGSLLGGWATDRFGRKLTLLIVGVLYVLSAVGCGFASGVGMFIFARFIGGLGIGISTVAAPLYISEIAPPAYRGRLAGMFQFNIVFGIVIAFLSNAVIAHLGGEHAWRWMLGIAAFPSVVYAVMCFGLPESPRWLICRKGDRAAGLAVLQLIEPDSLPAQREAHADVLMAAARTEKDVASTFWTWRLRQPICLAILVATFNQLSGVNAILYFAPRIFEMSGLGEKAALLQSVGIGITNLIFTFVGLWLIDRLGRRPLLYLGSFGYIVSLGLTSWAFFTQHFAIVPACIIAFMAAHAVGQGAVIWVLISEIFPNRHRAEGQALGSFTHWLFAALLTTFFPTMVAAFAPGYIFLFFCFMMVLQLIWVKTMVPETKGRSLEEIQHQFG